MVFGVEMSLERIVLKALFEWSSYHTSSNSIVFFFLLVPIHMPQWFAVADVVACDVGTLLKLKMPTLSLYFPLSFCFHLERLS